MILMFVCVCFVRTVLMTDREERSVICTCAINLSAQSCALRIATAFSKGTGFNSRLEKKRDVSP